MALPAKFVTEGLALAKGAKIFGEALEDLTRDELLAVAAQGWKAERNAREQAIRQFEHGLTLGGASPMQPSFFHQLWNGLSRPNF